MSKKTNKKATNDNARDGSAADIAAIKASIQISRQLDKEKIGFLGDRVKSLLSSNNELRSTTSRNEKDTHDIVLYFQREMEIKDAIITNLEEELIKRETMLKHELDSVKKKYDAEMQDFKQDTDAIILTLTTKLEEATTELTAVDEYVKERIAYETKLKKLGQEIVEQRQQTFDAIDDQERKFLEEKSALLKSFEEQKQSLTEQAIADARQAMGAEIKKILRDNERAHEELKFLHSATAQMQTDKLESETQLAVAKREVELLTEKEIEYAKQSFQKSKEVASLREKIDALEKEAATNMDRFRQRTKDLKNTIQKDLEVATLDAYGLRRLLEVKNVELRNMKMLAATILSQRSDTEKFFLEAFNEVKEKKLAELKKLRGKSTGGGGAGGTVEGSFPAIRGHGAPMSLGRSSPKKSVIVSAATAGQGDPAGSDVNTNLLAWDEKEKVLRLLFAKINNGWGVKKASQNFDFFDNSSVVDTLYPAVFISEGVDMLDQNEHMNFVAAYETSQDSSEGALQQQFIDRYEGSSKLT